MTTMRRYCTCGAAWSYTGTSLVVETLALLWAELHTGFGHEPCDATTASHNRRLNELRQEQEDQEEENEQAPRNR